MHSSADSAGERSFVEVTAGWPHQVTERATGGGGSGRGGPLRDRPGERENERGDTPELKMTFKGFIC